MTNYRKTRAIHTVRDTNLPVGQQFRQAQAILDPLTPAGLANLRLDLGTAHAAGSARFLCAVCNMPLYIAQDPAGPDVPSDGRGAHFKHFPAENAPHCDQRSEASVRDIGAVKFAGLQEGADHAELKHMLALSLSHDPSVSDVRIERQIRGADGDWRQPDVSAVMAGRLVAFDLQLATAPLTTILERTAFYAANGVSHVWLTSADDLSRLSQLAFRDLHLNSGGRIFAIDADVVAASIQTGQFKLKELSLAPRLAPAMPIHNIWEVALADKATILIDPLQRKQEGEALYRQKLAVQVTEAFALDRKIIRQAAAERKNLGWVQPQWSRISHAIKGRSLDQAQLDRVSEVVAWLYRVELFAGTVDPAARLAAIGPLQVATHVLLAVRNAKDWTPLVEMICDLDPSVLKALSTNSQVRLTALLGTKDKVAPVLRLYAGMLSVLFTWLAFRLLVKPPKFLPKLGRSGDTL